MKTIATTIAAILLTGCSGFKLGAFCYLPSGADAQAGQCTIVTVPAAQSSERK